MWSGSSPFGIAWCHRSRDHSTHDIWFAIGGHSPLRVMVQQQNTEICTHSRNSTLCVFLISMSTVSQVLRTPGLVYGLTWWVMAWRLVVWLTSGVNNSKNGTTSKKLTKKRHLIGISSTRQNESDRKKCISWYSVRTRKIPKTDMLLLFFLRKSDPLIKKIQNLASIWFSQMRTHVFCQVCWKSVKGKGRVMCGILHKKFSETLKSGPLEWFHWKFCKVTLSWSPFLCQVSSKSIQFLKKNIRRCLPASLQHRLSADNDYQSTTFWQIKEQMLILDHHVSVRNSLRRPPTSHVVDDTRCI